MIKQLYNDFSVFASISKDSKYYDYLVGYFGKENIYILNLSKANIMRYFAECLEKTKNDKIILIPPTSKVFNESISKEIKYN